MKVIARFYDEQSGDLIDEVHTDLHRFRDENPNAPADWVIRDEIREIGAYITRSHGVRCEVVKA